MSLVTYKEIDNVFLPWANKHGFHVYTQVKDEETRHVIIEDNKKDQYDLWAIPDIESNNLAVSVGAALRARASKKHTFYRERKKYYANSNCSLIELETCLNQLLNQIESWSKNA